MTLSLLFFIFLGYLWLWLFRKLRKDQEFHFLKLGTLSASLVLLLIGIEKLLGVFQVSLLSLQGETIFFLTISCYFFMLFFGVFRQRRTKSGWLWGILLGILGIFGYSFLHFPFGFSFGILLLSVYAEELLKIGTGSFLFEKYSKIDSDFLFFSLIIAIGFSFFENGYYLAHQIFVGNETLTSMLSLTLGRGIFASLLHLLTTGLIALLLFKRGFFRSYFFRSFFILLGSFFFGVLIHFLYDYFQVATFLIYGIVLIGGYFFLTYLFYLSDQIYLEKTE